MWLIDLEMTSNRKSAINNLITITYEIVIFPHTWVNPSVLEPKCASIRFKHRLRNNKKRKTAFTIS
jgi:hypothetical protein